MDMGDTGDIGTQGPRGIHPGENPYAGIPWRGPTMNMRKDDPPHMQPKINYDPHVKVFDLEDEDEVEEYLKILKSITMGQCILGKEEVRFDQKTGSWKVMMRWYDQFLTAPQSAGVASNGNQVWGNSSGQNGS